jgi:hypothetical protein
MLVLSLFEKIKMVLTLSKKTKPMELVLNDKVDAECDLIG